MDVPQTSVLLTVNSQKIFGKSVLNVLLMTQAIFLNTNCWILDINLPTSKYSNNLSASLMNSEAIFIKC